MLKLNADLIQIYFACMSRVTDSDYHFYLQKNSFFYPKILQSLNVNFSIQSMVLKIHNSLALKQAFLKELT